MADLDEVQNDLKVDKMNGQRINTVKKCTEKLMMLNNIEEQMLRQHAKVDNIILGDGYNVYFHATLKGKQNQSNLKTSHNSNGVVLQIREEIKGGVLDFHGNIM